MKSINQGLVSHPFFLTPFRFNSPYQFTPLPNFQLLICDMTLIFHLWKSFYGNFFITSILFMLTFSGTQLGRKTRPWCNFICK